VPQRAIEIDDLQDNPLFEDRSDLILRYRVPMQAKQRIANPDIEQQHAFALQHASRRGGRRAKRRDAHRQQGIVEQIYEAPHCLLRNLRIRAELRVVQPLSADCGNHVEKARIASQVLRQRFGSNLQVGAQTTAQSRLPHLSGAEEQGALAALGNARGDPSVLHVGHLRRK
jgi:hypothetical protein